MAAENPNQVAVVDNLNLPEFVRFSPSDAEVVNLLKRHIRKVPMPNCAVKVGDPGAVVDVVSTGVWSRTDNPYFEEGHYWFFLPRKPVAGTAGPSKNKKVDRKLGEGLATWKPMGKNAKIYDGRKKVGLKQKFVLVNGEVGWTMFEYIRHSNKFEKLCVCHLIFEKKLEEEYPSDISASEEEGAEEEGDIAIAAAANANEVPEQNLNAAAANANEVPEHNANDQEEQNDLAPGGMFVGGNWIPFDDEDVPTISELFE